MLKYIWKVTLFWIGLKTNEKATHEAVSFVYHVAHKLLPSKKAAEERDLSILQILLSSSLPHIL